GTHRMLFVSDLHGSEVCFRKFLNSVDAYHPDLLVYGGDILGKVLVPIFDDGGSYHWYPNGENLVRFPASELPRVQRAIADQGRYSVTVSPERWDELQGRPRELEELTFRLGRERVRSWLKLIDERLAPRKIPIVMNVGKDDRRTGPHGPRGLAVRPRSRRGPPARPWSLRPHPREQGD